MIVIILIKETVLSILNAVVAEISHEGPYIRAKGIGVAN